MKTQNLLALAVLIAVCLLLQPSRVSAESGRVVTVQSVELERTGGENYFRIKLTWPDTGVPTDHRQFAKSTGMFKEFIDHRWPVDAVWLIPDKPGDIRIFRELHSAQWESRSRWAERPEAAVSFVGKTATPGKTGYHLRCPNQEGGFDYLPVSVDFSRAQKANDLKTAWQVAQVEFMASYPAPHDQSFFAYAYKRLSAGLKKGIEVMFFQGAARLEANRDRLYEITTGALALQESLQLDRMRETSQVRGKQTIPISKIEGVNVRSHPWKEMIGAERPTVEPIARLVPHDQYYVRFNTSKSFKQFVDFVHSWGGSLLAQMEVGGRDTMTREKLEQQICLRATWLSDLLGPMVVDSLAVTGTDAYLREGSDFSVIFRLKSPAVFETVVNRFIDQTRQQHPDLKEKTEQHRGVRIQGFITDDLQVRCYRARVAEYYVYSNSPAAIRRIIDTFKGKRPCLADSLDFVYMRRLYPLDDKQEDGLVFLSDAWLRWMTGPALRIGEKRRIETVTSLEMVKNAALLYLWEHPGAAAPDMKTLVRRKYLDERRLLLEPGDRILWDPETFTARSKKYGRLGYLTPHLEMPITLVSAQEKQEYETFRNRYQDYWRTFFDPVGIRVRSDRDIQLDVTILPLIDNNAYNQMKNNLGGKSIELEPVQRGGPVAFHVAGHFNPESDDYKQMQTFAINMLPGSQRAVVEWLGERFEFWMEDSESLLSAADTDGFLPLVAIPMVFGIEVKSKMGLAAFLVAVQSMIRTSAPNLVVFEPTEPYKGFTFTAIRPSSEQKQQMAQLSEFALYYGSVGDMLFISNSLASLKRIVDSRQPGESTASADERYGGAKTGHLAIRVDGQAGQKFRQLLERLMLARAAQAEDAHLRNLWLVQHTTGLSAEPLATAQRVLGYRIDSALGNRFSYRPQTDDITGTVSGSLWQRTRLTDPPDDAPLTRLLRSLKSIRTTLEFTAEGLKSALSIKR